MECVCLEWEVEVDWAGVEEGDGELELECVWGMKVCLENDILDEFVGNQ